MAKDIAFCVGVLRLLEDRVPRGLVMFVTALAIFDDIGRILAIALFYGHGLSLPWLAGAGAVCLVLFGMNRSAVRSGFAWLVAGAALWYALHHGGIHATIAGDVSVKKLYGVSVVAGIGFTVALFIAGLAPERAVSRPAQRDLARLSRPTPASPCRRTFRRLARRRR